MTPAASVAGREPPVIAIRGLRKHFGPIAALDGVDLDVRRGEAVLLLGPNGAGKSTLLRLLAGLARPSAGRLEIYGRAPAGAGGAAVRRRIGLLSHQTFLYDHLTAQENLEFYARLYQLDAPRAAAEEALSGAGLLERAGEPVQGFSRGMQQRLAIARATLHRPDLLLLDEPFTGLDRDAAGRLRDSLQELRASARTCVVTTHEFSSGLAIADRIIILAAGRPLVDRPSAGLDAVSLDLVFQEATRPARRPPAS